jgi:hypothetical protein
MAVALWSGPTFSAVDTSHHERFVVAIAIGETLSERQCSDGLIAAE